MRTGSFSFSRLVTVLLLLAFILLKGGCQRASARVVLSKLFVDGGIIQRDKPVNVFGTARPGEIVTCEIGGSKSVCIIPASGNFLFLMPAPSGDGPFTLRVAGDNLVEIKNLQLGEIWVVLGDSEIDKSATAAGGLTAESALPENLQLFKVGTKFATRPVRMVDGHWIKATETGAMDFSNLGLKFGVNLAKQVGGQIGLIQVTSPETPIRSWISTVSLLAKSETSGAPAKSTLDQKDFDKLTQDYKDRMQQWQSSMAEGKEPTPPPLPSPLLRNYASALFNGMIAPLTPYSVRGLIWYHGMSDLNEVLNYKAFISVFMKDIRQALRQEGLPIILVQAGCVAEKQTGDDSPVSVLRHVQFKARLAPRTYMAVSLDLNHVDKKTDALTIDYDGLANRITNIALSTQYHTPVPTAAPVIDTVEQIQDGEALKLQLRHAEKGLTYSGKGEIKGFTLSGWNHQYFDADVKLDGNCIILQSKYLKEPKFVRYCWGNCPTINLFSQDGLPLAPFANDR